MESLFKSIDVEENPKRTFWVPVKDKSKKQLKKRRILKSTLNLLTAAGSYKQRTIVLTSSHLYYISSKNQVTKFTKINWKLLEAFQEPQNKKKCGFKLSNQVAHQVFYTRNSKQQTKWVDALSCLCINKGFELEYQVLEKLGCGNFACVNLVREIKTSKIYAAKSVSKRVLRIENCEKNLLDEILAMKKLDHPSIPKLHKVYESYSEVHLITDYVEGGTCLQRLYKKGPFSEESAAKLVYILLETIDYMHSKNIAHRDIKAENILMCASNNYEIKLIDFGLVCRSIHKGNTERCGSPGYIAPEVLKGLKYGPKVDVFSTGILLYILLSGISPFGKLSVEKMLAANLKCDIKFPEELWGGISMLGKDIVMQLTNPDPLKRPSASEALQHPWFELLVPPYFTLFLQNGFRTSFPGSPRTGSFEGYCL